MLPSLTAELSLIPSRRNSIYRANGQTQDERSVIIPQVSCFKRCCPSGDCDTTCCANGGAGVTLTCHGGKANVSCNACFLTTACTAARGLPDDCHELTLLRQFRDKYLLSNAEGRFLVDEYYRIAPAICQAVDALENPLEVYDYLYRELVQPTVTQVEAGELDAATKHYVKFTLSLHTLLGIGNK